MTLAVICAGGTGLLLGLSLLRVPAVLAASIAALVAGGLLTAVASWSLFGSVMYCASLLVTLQIGYLLGGALACARSR